MSHEPCEEPCDLCAAPVDEVTAALGDVLAALPGGGERRAGQAEMAHAVHETISDGTMLVCQAGTGVGKSIAYLVPAVLAAATGRRVVIATATLALQDQLVGKDLPLVVAGMRERIGRPLRWEILKGRSNYLCRHRFAQHAQQLLDYSDGLAGQARQRQLAAIEHWMPHTRTGDRSELAVAPDDDVWSSLSVTSTECIGAERCPHGDSCFAEQARTRSATASIVVTNQHLYCTDLFGDGHLLGPHDAVIVDEAHQLEPVVTQVAGWEITPTGLERLAAQARTVGVGGPSADGVAAVATRLATELEPLRDTRLGAITGDLVAVLESADGRVADLTAELRRADPRPTSTADADLERVRVARLAAESLTALRAALEPPTGTAILVDCRRRLRLAPLDVGEPPREPALGSASVSAHQCDARPSFREQARCADR